MIHITLLVITMNMMIWREKMCLTNMIEEVLKTESYGDMMI